MKYTIKPIVCDYAVIRIGTPEIVCICNIKRNAELIADILNADTDNSCAYSYDVYPNAKYRVIKAESEDVETNTGYWVEEIISVGSRKIFCSKCGCAPPFEHISDGNVYSASGYGVINKTKFCPNCGIRMVEPQEGDKCSKCKYHINPDYTRCKECGAERSDKK